MLLKLTDRNRDVEAQQMRRLALSGVLSRTTVNRPGALPASPQRLRWLAAYVAASAFALTSACDSSKGSEPLRAVQLSAAQTEALRKMNEAGAIGFAGYTWRYQFGSGCVLRVLRAFEGHNEAPQDHVMAGRQIEVLAYAGRGYGVKAFGKGGSVDLFDSASSAQAGAFTQSAARLVENCAAR